MRSVLLALTALLSSAAGLRVTAPPEQPLRANQPLTLVFQLHNDTQTLWRSTPELELPRGWHSLFPAEEVQLSPGEDAALLLPVTAPVNAAAGVYAVRVSASGVQAAATVRVPVVRSVTVRAEAEDQLSLDGNVSATFLVRNEGNTPEALTFSAQPSGLNVTLPGTTLGPGEQAQIRVAGVVPQTSSPSRRITLTVQGQGGLSKTASVTRLQLQSAMPLEERSLILKGQIKFSVWPHVAPELALSGRVSNKLPGTVSLAITKTTWSARYQDKDLAFGVGDLSVARLPLQPGLRIFGVSAAIKRNGWWATSSAGEQGGEFAGNVLLGYSAAQMGAAVGISTSAASRTVAAQFSARFKSLRGELNGALDLKTLAPNVQAALSYSDSLTAGRVQAQYRGADVAQQASAELSLTASFRRQLAAGVAGTLRSEFQLKPLLPGAQATFSVTGQLTDHGNSWSTYWRMVGAQSAGTGLNFDSRRWHSSFAWTPTAVTFQTKVSLALASVSLQPSVSTTLNLNSSQWVTSAGLQANWTYRNGVASLGVTSPATQGGAWNLTGSAALQVGEAAVKLSAMSAFGAGQPRVQVGAAVSYPLELVTARRSDVGSLEGQVRYPDGRPLAGLRLRAGTLTALTDAAGHFSFPDVREGTVLLDLFNQGDAAGLRARPTLPLQVTVRGQQVSRVELQFSPGATIQGQLKLHWPTPQEAAGTLIVPEAPALSNLTVRLSAAKVSYESRLNADGTFWLNHVSTGTYEVTLLAAGKPLKTAHLTRSVVAVLEDEALTLALDLIPITQEMHIEDAGELKLH